MTELESALTGPKAQAVRFLVGQRLAALQRLCEQRLRQGHPVQVREQWTDILAAVLTAQRVVAQFPYAYPPMNRRKAA